MHASALPMQGVLRLNVQRGVVGRAMVHGCPSQRLPADEHPVHPAENHRMTNSHNHPPKPFPEGEIFHSPGLTRSGYPGWGTSIKHLNPNGVRLTQGAIGAAVALDRAPTKHATILPTVSLKTPIKPAPSGLIFCTGPQPRVVLRTNPGLSKNVPSGHGLDGCRSREESRLSPGRVVGRAMVFGCPSQRLPPDERPAAGGRESGAAESG